MRKTLAIILLFEIATLLVPASGNCAAAGEKPFYRATAVGSPTLRFARCHSSHIIALPDGSLLAAWWSGSEEAAADNVILSPRRPPGHDVWQDTGILADTPDTTDSNPVFFHAGGDHLWLLYRTDYPWANLMRIRSHDMGFTWSEPEVFLDGARVTLRSSMLQSRSGTIIIPLMKLPQRDINFSWAKSAFLISRDDGDSWNFSEELSSVIRCNEPALVQLKDGRLLSFMRPYGDGKDRKQLFIVRSESTDQGHTWSEPEYTGLKNPSSAVDLLMLDNGHLVLAFNDDQYSRTSLRLALSRDEGNTWISRRILEDAAGRFSYPSLAQSADGMIHVTYTFRRTHIKHVETNEAWIVDQH